MTPASLAPLASASCAGPASAPLGLDELGATRRATVLAVDGQDALASRLCALGLWPGAVVERIAHAPFGDPLLFRLHGYRLALRRCEAARVRVAEFPA